MTVPFPGPTVSAGSRAEVFVRYLDYFRDRVRAKLRELPDDELRRSRLPSGWTPIELLRHLTYVELRWLEWGSRVAPSMTRGATGETTAGTSAGGDPR